jgi:pyruvate/2-oxoglutarate dehydrogenase complex dihydrolipoamide dehydrogenase (E3) component
MVSSNLQVRGGTNRTDSSRVVANAKSERLLGAQIIGAEVSALIVGETLAGKSMRSITQHRESAEERRYLNASSLW